MTKRTFFILIFILQAFWGWSQYVVKSNEELGQLKKVPQEKVYISHTGPVFLSGEYMYYAFYCFNAQINRKSTISRVGYVALVNEQGEYVFEQKIRLKSGLGQGDYFISTEIPSGNYKLLGYTQWMKNNGLAQVFKDDITIINPYQVDQSTLLTAAPLASTALENTESDIPVVPLHLEFVKKQFKSREPVSFDLRNYQDKLGFGTYSIQIKKKDELTNKMGMRAEDFAVSYKNVNWRINKNVGDSLFLPEQRGELVFGSVKDRTTKEPAAEVPVVISFPGKEFILKLATTDASGNFYAYIKKEYPTPEAIIQIVDEDVAYDIELQEQRKLNVADLEFGKFHLKEDMKAAIEKRSVYNQIENQFFALKPDSVLQGDRIDPFNGNTPEVVRLDDYTRFRTFQETLVEILPYAGYRIGGKDNDYIRILQDFERVTEEYNDFPALVLIDGVFIPNHEAIKEYDARKIETISLIQEQFQLEGKLYQGLLLAETFDGDYALEHTHKNLVKPQIDLPIAKKNYYQQRYLPENKAYKRVPDYRRLLFWQPIIELDASVLQFDFFTSDIKGEYEVILDGFTTYGKPISIRETFRVN